MSTADIQLSVVFGGQYSFEKLQSDWDQTDSLERDFIKNKPDLDNMEVDTITTDSIIFRETPAEPTLSPREMQWDAPNGTFAFGLPDGGSIQIGQEDFDFYTNVDTVPLTEGMPVSSVSIPGNRNAIKRTDPTSRASAEAFLGLVTVSSIAVNGVGRVTLRGEVSPFNTSGFAENATLYVTGTGTIGTSEPAAGTYKIIVGTVAVSANNGTINVNKYIRPKLTELSDVDGTTTLMNNGDKLMKQEVDGVVRFITYQNVKADLKSVNDALYEPILGFTPVDSADLGQANGVATLDNDGLVPASQLPSFVDDIVDSYGTYTDVSDPTTIIELWTDASHTVAVDKYTGKIYVDVVTRFQFRWSGSVWGAILSGPVQSVAGKTGNVLLVKGDVGLSNVDNTSDVNKPISTSVSIALGGKVSTTGDETIAGVKTFQSSPIVPDNATGKQAVNYDQMDAYVTAELGLPPVEVEGSVGLEENASGEVGIGVAPETGTKLKVAGASKFGGAVNNVTIDANGHITFNGAATIFDDMTADIARTRTVGTRVTVNDVESTLDMTTLAALADYGIFDFQLPHGWKVGSKVYPHIHWFQAEANTPNFLLQYRWQSNGGAKDTTWKNLKCNTSAFSYVSGVLNQISYVADGVTPPAGAMLSDIMQIRIIRDNANASTIFAGADPYTATVSVTSVDVHVEKNAIGSNDEYLN